MADQPVRHRFIYLIDFACLQCGRWMFSVRTRSGTAAIYLDSRRRCTACGGTGVRSGDIRREDAVREVLPDDPELKHRGRPTKAMLAARQAAQQPADARRWFERFADA